ncbi:hypothetical protein [Streptomyces zinciresistens]|nr:hypothetical protein [Streptomyces zinciresistens]
MSERLRQSHGHVGAYTPQFHEPKCGRADIDSERWQHDVCLIESRP